MGTFLFNEIIFGPVKSRRLGISLGINLLPVNRKICNYDCIYCECGWNSQNAARKPVLPTREEVSTALEMKLLEMKNKGEAPDVITYAGNGEPTLHPAFPGIIDDSIMLRNRYFPEARIAVLSNATTIGRPQIREALLKADQNILKLDTVYNDTLLLHNQPSSELNIQELIENLASFNGHVIIQTLFLKGSFNGMPVDNTTEQELEGWLEALRKIKPSEVMIYTISRDTPAGGDLKKIPVHKLEAIAERVRNMGIRAAVSG